MIKRNLDKLCSPMRVKVVLSAVENIYEKLIENIRRNIFLTHACYEI